MATPHYGKVLIFEKFFLMASVIDRNRLSWHSREEKTAVRPRRFICLQLGYHKTQGASRLLIFCFFSKPSSLHSLGVIRWIDNLDETPISRKDTEEEFRRPWGPRLVRRLAPPRSASPRVPPASEFSLSFPEMGNGVLTRIRAAAPASGMTWK